MLVLDPDVLTLVALGAAGLSVVLLLLVGVLLLRIRRLSRAQLRAFDVGDGDDVVSALGRHGAQLARLEADLEAQQVTAARLRERLRGTVSRVGVVRYDAFEDMGGALSFSAALLDERGNGLVVSAINGRTETRSYAKAVQAGESEHSLSAEELAAIDHAVRQSPPTTLPPMTGRWRRRAS